MTAPEAPVRLQPGQKWYPTRTRESWRTIVSTSGQGRGSVIYQSSKAIIAKRCSQDEFFKWIERTRAELLGPVHGCPPPPPPPLTAAHVLQRELDMALVRQERSLVDLESAVARIRRFPQGGDGRGLVTAAAWAADVNRQIETLAHALRTIADLEVNEEES